MSDDAGAAPLLVARGLRRSFPIRGRRGERRAALAGVDVTVAAGECLAVVGESGSGKTTLVRCLVALLAPDAGEVRFEGAVLGSLSRRELRRRRRGFQIVFQDPGEALDPLLPAGAQVAEPLAVHGIGEPATRRARTEELFAAVGLAPELAQRLPFELSGGERQRVAIARALAPGPRLLVLDEPVSALDAAIRSQVLDLLADLRRRLGLALVVVTHDLTTVGRMAERIAVLFAGRIVEEGPAAEVLARPRHPYTAALLAAVPVADPSRRGRLREVAAPFEEEPATGCRYHRRCPAADHRCRAEEPRLADRDGGAVACHHPLPVGPAAGPGGASPTRPESL